MDYFPPDRLLEMYQLVVLYYRQCGDTRQDLPGFILEIEERYEKITGKSIRKARNPRGAGRPIKEYDKDTADKIKKVYKACGSIRQTARECGISTTKVYRYINS